MTGHQKLPVDADEHVEGAVTPSSVKVIDSDAANPAPVAIVTLPTIPLAGFSESSSVTVNVVETIFVASDAFIV